MKLISDFLCSSHAPSNLFVLLSWSCGLYTTCVKCDPDFSASNSFRVLVGSMAFLLDMLSESSMVKPSMKRGAVVRVRRALRSAGDKVHKVIEALLALSKTNPSPTRLVTLIGVCVGVVIHLKNVTEPPSERLQRDLQTGILSLYTSSVIVSKTSIPPHIPSSLEDFISTFISPDDFEKTILPVFERSLLRSPELSLPVVTQFFQSYAQALKPDLFKKMVTQVVNSSKSTNPVVRTNSIALFQALLSTTKAADEAQKSELENNALTELLALPKTSKTAGPDHRVALYSMLGLISPSSTVSPALVQNTIPLLGKETNEAAISVLAASLPPHITYILHSSNPVPNEVVQLIAKEMGNAKPAVRRAFANLVGSIFFVSEGVSEGEHGKVFAKGVAPALENALKTVASNAVNAPGGPLEGYVALAVLLGPLEKSGAFGKSLQNAPRNTSDLYAQMILFPKMRSFRPL